MHFSSAPCVLHVQPYHFRIYHHPNNIWRRVQIVVTMLTRLPLPETMLRQIQWLMNCKGYRRTWLWPKSLNSDCPSLIGTVIYDRSRIKLGVERKFVFRNLYNRPRNPVSYHEECYEMLPPEKERSNWRLTVGWDSVLFVGRWLHSWDMSSTTFSLPETWLWIHLSRGLTRMEMERKQAIKFNKSFQFFLLLGYMETCFLPWITSRGNAFVMGELASTSMP
jgi:hypothetical protein